MAINISDINEKELGSLRYEKKFVITELSSGEIEHLIKFSPAIFSEIFYERRVNNIYLDSIDYENYRDNLAGNADRIKIRIRWYGKIFDLVKNPVLELKIKNNELGRKISFPLKLFVLDKNFSLDLLQENFSKSNLPRWLIEKLKLYQFSLLDSYKRRYFISADKDLRITFDRDLIFFRIKNKNNSFKEKIINKENYILELKYLFKDYEKVKDYFPFRIVANSKYVFGVNLLDL